MLDLGFQELIVIFIVALLVFGPKKLPELARTLGRGIGELKAAIHGVKVSIEQAEAEAERIERDISEGLKEQDTEHSPPQAEQDTENDKKMAGRDGKANSE